MAPLLLEQPRGLLLFRDELAGWLQGFNQFKGGRGSDVPQWLEMHGARSITVDRKTGKPKTIMVPRAAVSVTGGIQPGILGKVLRPEYFDNGLAARLLMACPPRTARKWSDVEIPEELEVELEGVFRVLFALRPGIDGDGQSRPVRLELTTEAKGLFVQFINRNGLEQCNLDVRGGFVR
ncbi:MAG: DUF3987 domain-containing protein [bacterium]|nr:DUF3987 domain-containing protein [bacterium]